VWSRDKDADEATATGDRHRLALVDIASVDVVQEGDKLSAANVMCVRTGGRGNTESRQIYWQANERDELNEWFVALRAHQGNHNCYRITQITRQIRRVQHAATTDPNGTSVSTAVVQSEQPGAESTNHAQSGPTAGQGDVDIERQLERVHYACVQHADTLIQWRSELGADPVKGFVAGIEDAHPVPLTQCERLTTDTCHKQNCS
jgi:hypothetical protein